MPKSFDLHTRQNDIYRYVASRVSKLQGGYLSDAGRGNAARQLAELRRAAGKEPRSTPSTWSIEFDGCPESLVGIGQRPSEGEHAIHAALTLYAIHQQSQKQGMHCAGKEHDFGSAVRRYVYLNRGSENLEDGRLPRRFAAMVTADSFDEVVHYARQLIKMLRSEGIAIDYGRLARQLFLFQDPYARQRVLLEWGRGYARTANIGESAGNEKGQESS